MIKNGVLFILILLKFLYYFFFNCEKRGRDRARDHRVSGQIPLPSRYSDDTFFVPFPTERKTRFFLAGGGGGQRKMSSFCKNVKDFIKERLSKHQKKDAELVIEINCELSFMF